MVVPCKPPYAAIATVNLTRTLRAAYALTRTLRAACATLRQPWFSNGFCQSLRKTCAKLTQAYARRLFQGLSDLLALFAPIL